MSYTSFRIKDVIDNAVSHDWSVPEFQRGFVWKPNQVRDLAESLWRNYPVGSVLIWNSVAQRKRVEPKNMEDARSPTMWLVDGQQRATALCLLAGRKPYWWPGGQSWNDVIKRNDVRFDINAKSEPYFVLSSGAVKKSKGNRYVPVRDLIALDLDRDDDQKKLTDLAKDIKSEGLCDGLDAMEVKTRLERVCRIRQREIVGITVDHELEDVVEIFGRLNSRGTRVRESDIYLGVVAARQPGWVRSEFMPYLDQLVSEGFEIGPNVLFQSLTAVGVKRVRFKDINDQFWDSDSIKPAWDRMKKAWAITLKFLEPYGILTNRLMPSDAVFITLSALFDKFPDMPRSNTFTWLVQALRYGRYSGSSTTSLEEDLKDIDQAPNGEAAVSALLTRIRAVEPISSDEFLRDYGENRFGRLMLYLLAFSNKARDWNGGSDRIAFHGDDLVRGFSPQFHHIFPRDFLKNKAPEDKIEALANIAVIGAETNIRISNKDPLAYFVKYGIDENKRKEQHIDGDVAAMTPEAFPTWLEDRARLLAAAANELLTTASDNSKT